MSDDDLRDRLTLVIRRRTDAWDEPLDDVHDVPVIVDAVMAVLAESAGGDTAATSPNDDAFTERVSVETEPVTDALTDEAIRAEAERRWPLWPNLRNSWDARRAMQAAFEAGARWQREQSAPTVAPDDRPLGTHPDGEAANAIAGIITDRQGWTDLTTRYGIAHDVLHWLDEHRPEHLAVMVDLVGQDVRAVYGDTTADYVEESIRQHLDVWLREGPR